MKQNDENGERGTLSTIIRLERLEAVVHSSILGLGVQ